MVHPYRSWSHTVAHGSNRVTSGATRPPSEREKEREREMERKRERRERRKGREREKGEKVPPRHQRRDGTAARPARQPAARILRTGERTMGERTG